MTESSAELGLIVDSSGALTAVGGLEKLTGAAQKTERATEELTRATEQTSAAQKRATQVLEESRAATEASRARMRALREEHEGFAAIMEREVAARQSGLSASARQYEAARTEQRSEEQLYQAKLRSMEIEQRRAAMATRTSAPAAAAAVVQAETQMAAAATKTAAAQVAVEQASKKAGLGIGALREPLTSTIALMSGMNPVATRLTSIIGTMALGTATMVGVLAGIAALSAGYNKLTEDSRMLREAEERRVATLQSLRAEQTAAALGKGGQAALDLSAERTRIAPTEASLSRAQQQLSVALTPSAIKYWTEQVDDLNRKVQESASYQQSLLKVINDDNRAREQGIKTLDRRIQLQRELAGVLGQEGAAQELANLRYQEAEELAAARDKYNAHDLAGAEARITAYYAEARALASKNAEQEKSARMTEVEIGPVINRDLTQFSLPGRRPNLGQDPRSRFLLDSPFKSDAGILDMTRNAREMVKLEDQIQANVKRTNAALAEQAALRERNRLQQEATAKAARDFYIQQGLSAVNTLGSGLSGSGHATAGAITSGIGAVGAGALAGATVGPLGAVLGGATAALASFVGGLVGHNQAAKEAAEREKQLTEERLRAAREYERSETESLELRELHAEGEILKAHGKTEEAKKKFAEEERRRLEQRNAEEIIQFQKNSNAFGGLTLAEIQRIQQLELEALALQGVSDEVKKLTGDINGPQGLRRSLYLWRTTGDSGLWGPNPGGGAGGGGGSGGASGGGGTVINNNGDTTVVINMPPGTTIDDPKTFTDEVFAEIRRRQLNGAPNMLALGNW